MWLGQGFACFCESDSVLNVVWRRCGREGGLHGMARGGHLHGEESMLQILASACTNPDQILCDRPLFHER